MRDDEPSVAYEPAPWTAEPQAYFARRQPPRSLRLEYGLPALLFVLTACTMYWQGRSFFLGWQHAQALTLVASVFSIMLAHEMGHYLFCRFYRVDATLPHFLPAPYLGIVGTFGAFIRIRGPIPHRRALFDIGVAGPLAGFAVTAVVGFLALGSLRIVPGTRPETGEALFNYPTLVSAIAWALELPDQVPDGMMATINEPLLVATWFGALLTALNLFPVGQLDGGHVVYALLRQHSVLVSRAGLMVCVALVYFSPSWILWSILLLVFGRRHPFTLDDEAPVGAMRGVIGLIAAAVFALCFTASPLHMSWSMLLAG